MKNWKFSLLAILGSIFFLISSCKPDPLFDNYTIFVLLSPTDPEQLDLSSDLLDQIDKNLIFPGVRYEIHGICNHIQNIESLVYSKNRKKSIVTNQAFMWLKEIQQKSSENKCNNDLEELSAFINTVDDSLDLREAHNMIVISQIPWSEINANKELIGELKNEVDSIKNKERIRSLRMIYESLV